MYSYIKGELVEVLDDAIVIEAGQIGYHIRIPGGTMDAFRATGQTVKIYTYLYVREDAMHLYGFLTKDNLNMFKLLIGISGIGPKGALAILSVMTPDDLRFAILGEDAKTISKAPGVGNKTAQRLIIELKDKLHLEDAFAVQSNSISESMPLEGKSKAKSEAIQALVALGYSTAEAMKALSEIETTDDTTVEVLLKEALRSMAF
ncbi:Holliday junction branch migration protein RuvA [Lachnospiraceae bacterium ZAX-1]